MDSFCLIKQALGCLCRFAALSGSIALSVDAATITGQVEDADNAIFLEGAEVTIPSLDKSTFTTRRGNFRFTEIPAGTYEVIARASGYPQTIATVTVAEESDTVTTRLSFRRENIFELDDFIVEGTATGTAKALNIKRAAADLREVISSDAFGQFVDRNPAEALQRVPGVTVEDDQGEGAFVIIRGASPELANIQLDGIGIATPQPDGRRVNLNNR